MRRLELHTTNLSKNARTLFSCYSVLREVFAIEVTSLYVSRLSFNCLKQNSEI